MSRNPDSVAEAFGGIDREAGQIDVLVNNAGVQRVGARREHVARRLVPGSQHAPHRACICAAPQAIRRMRARGKGGAIVSIASAAGIVGIPGRGPYSAAKAGIEGLTRVYATETAAANIRVNAVAPGSTRTKLIEQGLQRRFHPLRNGRSSASHGSAGRAARDRRSRRLSRQRQGQLHHRPDHRGRRRMDGAGHGAHRGLAETSPTPSNG